MEVLINEMLKRGDVVECQVISVDEDRKRIALGLKQLAGDPWETTNPDKFQPGTVVTGKVTKITNFGVFVELEPELEGLLHISELADHKVDNPEEIVKVGQEIEVRVLRVDSAERKIGLSRRVPGSEGEAPAGGGDEAARGTAAPREELKGGTGSGSAGPLFTMGGGSADGDSEESSAP